MIGSRTAIAMTDFARNYGAVFERVANGKETITLLTHGRPRVVCVPVDEYDALIETKRNWDFMQARAFKNADAGVAPRSE